jgi:hypothetical protein
MRTPNIGPGARVMTQAEVDAYNAERAQRRADRAARKVRRDAAKVETAARRAANPRPADTLNALAVGVSHTFPQYKSTTQVSSAIRSAWIKNGYRYASKLARDLLTGENVIGVTVTRVS